MSQKLSTQTAAALQLGEVIRDHATPGLQLHAKKSGKFWFLYYRTDDGQRRCPKLPGPGYPLIGIEEARRVAKEWLQRVARGEDPSGERIAVRASPSILELVPAYVAYKSDRNKERSMVEMRRHLEIYAVREIGNLKVQDVTPADIERVLAAVEARKYTPKTHRWRSAPSKVSANRAREALRGMFRFAEMPSRLWRQPGTNPVKETEKHTERKRRVHVAPEQFAAVFRALMDAGKRYPLHVGALFVILYCGSRVDEILSAEWTEYDGERIVLTEHKTDRTGEDRIIYVPKQARRIIAALPVSPDTKIIFHGVNRRHMHTVWEGARDAAGCPHVQIRDFRRTFASVALSSGMNLDQIGELLGHGDEDTTKLYAWLTDSAAKTATQRTADTIEGFMIEGPKP